MPKVYIAAAFRRFSNRDEKNKAYGEIEDSEYVDFLERIEGVFLNFGFDTCLPHRDEGMWGKVYYDPLSIGSICFRHVQTSDVVFALAETGRGVHIELGYAAGFPDKKLIMMYKGGTEPSTLIYGIPNNLSPWKDLCEQKPNAYIEEYSDLTNLLEKLHHILAKEYGQASNLANTSTANKAIIDIGSHTIKLKILSYHPGSHSRAIYETKQSLGIIGDVIKTGGFSGKTIDDVVALIKRWKNECDKYSCNSIVVTGTAALRKANNAHTLISQLEEETSLELEILSPIKELEYVFSGVKETFRENVPIAVLNLGGGSTQLGVGSESHPRDSFLFDFGTRELTEKWPWIKPMTHEDYESLLAHVRERIRKSMPNKPDRVSRMVHTGGELDFMLRCRLPLRVSLLSPVHVSEISLDSFSRFSQEFSQLEPAYVSTNFGLDPAWASGAIASNVIALCAAEAVGAEAIIPSNYNISDGLLLR